MNFAAPDRETALQFALMLMSGMPSLDAIRYFSDADGMDEASLKVIHNNWSRSNEVRKALLQVQGKPWQQMSLEERIKYAIDKHYSEMAYFLYAHNYAELVGSDKQKADTCRQALEAKLAGMAGKMDALSRFWDDIVQGKVKLAPRMTNVPA